MMLVGGLSPVGVIRGGHAIQLQLVMHYEQGFYIQQYGVID